MGAAILQDLAVVMVVAAATTILFYRLRLPLVLGYLLAGFLIGPFTPPMNLITDQVSIRALAELGVIFLLFAVGLEFNLRKLRKVGVVAILGATCEIAIMIALGYGVGRAFGWSPMDSMFLGAILSISSTMIIVKVLMEMKAVEKEFAQVAFGILILEDILGVILIATLPGFAATGALDAGVVGAVAAKALLFILIAVSVGIVLVPRLIEWVSRFNVEEVLVITVVGLAFLAAIVAHRVGFSVELGAFLMGAIIAESRAVRSVEHKVVPIRDLFASVFFVAVGTLIDPAVLVAYWFPILVITGAVILGKVVSVALPVILAGYRARDGVLAGFTMAQIGEFGFIIAAIGIATGAMSPWLYPIAVAVCGITAFTSPLLIRWVLPLTARVDGVGPVWLSRFSARYRRATARLRAPDDAHAGVPPAENPAARILIYAAWFLGLLVTGAYLSLWLAGDVTRHLTPSDNVQRAIGLLFLGLFALPLVVAFTKATEAWGREIAKRRALKPQKLARQEHPALAPRVIARVAAGFASVGLVLLAIRIAWGVHPLALPATWLTALVLLALAGIAVLSWRRLERVYNWMEETLNFLLGQEEEVAQPLQRVRARYPFGVDAEEVAVLPHSWGAYQSIGDLSLDRTGVTVVSIERTGTPLAAPHPDTTLLPGDRVVLVGKRNEIDQAARLIHERWNPSGSLPRRPVQAEVRLPPGAPAVGATLMGSGLTARTGVSVAALRRRTGRAVPPALDPRLEAGDKLTLYGTPEELANARAYLGVAAGDVVRARFHSPPTATPSTGPAPAPPAAHRGPGYREDATRGL